MSVEKKKDIAKGAMSPSEILAVLRLVGRATITSYLRTRWRKKEKLSQRKCLAEYQSHTYAHVGERKTTTAQMFGSFTLQRHSMWMWVGKIPHKEETSSSFCIQQHEQEPKIA